MLSSDEAFCNTPVHSGCTLRPTPAWILALALLSLLSGEFRGKENYTYLPNNCGFPSLSQKKNQDLFLIPASVSSPEIEEASQHDSRVEIVI